MISSFTNPLALEPSVHNERDDHTRKTDQANKARLELR
jgi:hypothetical protein